MRNRFQGKVALVIGAGSSGDGWGNGKAAAALFAREGARVFAVDRDLNAVMQTQSVIQGEGGDCEVFQADVISPSDIAAMVAACQEKFGRIDVLLNNVGIAEVGGPVEASEESWHRVIAVNQTSIFLSCKHVLPIMTSQGSGAIVNIASVAASRYIGIPFSAYSASKAAVIALTKNMALEYASRGIRANCVSPGMMNTPMIRKPFADNYGGEDEMIRKRDAQCPMGFMGNGWDTANAAVFLASDEARYITGHDLVVDGGLSIACAVTQS
ncbi:MAG: SDR family NAD(P)-dependent oxidoreductase [Alphaproteobacteria bacterium]|nr:SDR family NAD(P)-dependent oxidoreductase [Alphaproteobacteria bacterium]